MQEKCSFLSVYVEIVAILAVFWMPAVRMEPRDILLNLRRFEGPRGGSKRNTGEPGLEKFEGSEPSVCSFLAGGTEVRKDSKR
jgi:hypothetical protein